MLNTDVEETICWGIDLYTRSNIYFSLPNTKQEPSEADKQHFISMSLLKAANRLKENGFFLD